MLREVIFSVYLSVHGEGGVPNSSVHGPVTGPVSRLFRGEWGTSSPVTCPVPSCILGPVKWTT